LPHSILVDYPRQAVNLPESLQEYTDHPHTGCMEYIHYEGRRQYVEVKMEDLCDEEIKEDRRNWFSLRHTNVGVEGCRKKIT